MPGATIRDTVLKLCSSVPNGGCRREARGFSTPSPRPTLSGFRQRLATPDSLLRPASLTQNAALDRPVSSE